MLAPLAADRQRDGLFVGAGNRLDEVRAVVGDLVDFAGDGSRGEGVEADVGEQVWFDPDPTTKSSLSVLSSGIPTRASRCLS
jgi:hypothetical protein